MRIGKFTFGMRGHDLGENLDDMCAAAVRNNVLNLQFALAKTVSHINFDEVGYDKAVSDSIRSKLVENDLKVSVLGCYIDPITQSTLDSQLTRFENFIPYAKDFNAAVIGTETGRLDTLEKTHSKECCTKLIKSLERLVPVAEKYGVCIGIEPVWCLTIYSVERMKEVLDYFKSDNLGVILDIVNLLNGENHADHIKITDKAVELFGDKIHSIHLKDYTCTDKLSAVPVGTGQLKIGEFLEVIGQMDEIPDIMLDEMPLANLAAVSERLTNIICR